MTDEATVSGITGHDGGNSWVQVFNYENLSFAGRGFELWACFTGSSPSAGTVVITKTGSPNYTWRAAATIIEIDEDVNGVDMSGTVANAFGVEGVDLGGYDATPYQIALGAFGDSGNLSFVTSLGQSADDYAFVLTGTYVSLGLDSPGSDIIEAFYQTSEDQTVDATSIRFGKAGIHAVEVKEGAVGGAPAAVPIPPKLMIMSWLKRFVFQNPILAAGITAFWAHYKRKMRLMK